MFSLRQLTTFPSAARTLPFVAALALLVACSTPDVTPLAATAPSGAEPTTGVEAPYPAPLPADAVPDAPAQTDLPQAQPETERPATETAPAETNGSTAAPDLLGVAPDSAAASNIDAMLGQLAARDEFSGVALVVHNGEVILRQGYGLADRDAGLAGGPELRYRIGSVTKPFTAAAILRLQQQGLLSVADPICNYLSDCPPDWQPITIHQLLTHTAGIPDLTTFPDFEATKGQPTTPAQTVARFRDRPLDFPPGSAWRYSNSGYILLGQIIENVSGQPYADFVSQNIFAPLGMADSGYDTGAAGVVPGYSGRGPNWAPAEYVDMSLPYSAGALYASADDLYRFDRALAHGDLLPPDLQIAMFSPVQAGRSGPLAGYGYGWYVGEQYGQPIYSHRGRIEGFAASIERYPQTDSAIILLANRDSVNWPGIVDGVSQALFSP